MGDRLRELLSDVIERCIQRVAELPDRTSPGEWPEAMLVTASELAGILHDELGNYVADRAVEPTEVTFANGRRVRLAAAPSISPPQESKENRMETVIYPCGCSATGTPSIPRYCPTHPRLTADELYRVMQAWEGQPASEEQTRIIVKLGAMREGAIRLGDSAFVTPLGQPIPVPSHES
jgi:hypothetical protein